MAIHKQLSVNGIPAHYWVIWDYSWNLVNNQTRVTIAGFVSKELFDQYPTNCLVKHDYTFDGQFAGFDAIEQRMTEEIITNRLIPDQYEQRNESGKVIVPFREAHNESYDCNILTGGLLDKDLLKQDSAKNKSRGNTKSIKPLAKKAMKKS